jgi:hypothetical protein
MIASISIAIATLGALLLCMLTMRIRAVDAGSNLKQHRAKDAGLADLLNYAAMVDDGVIVGKNGSFIAAWMYQGDDNTSSTDEQRDMVSFRINQALSGVQHQHRRHRSRCDLDGGGCRSSDRRSQQRPGRAGVLHQRRDPDGRRPGSAGRLRASGRKGHQPPRLCSPH